MDQGSEVVSIDLTETTDSKTPPKQTSPSSQQQTEEEEEEHSYTAPAAEGSKISLNVSDFNTYLKCILCDGYYRSAHTIAECLHTFCKSCIYLHFINSNRTCCPICLQDLGPHPLTKLIFDRTLQELVDHLFPSLKEQDKIKEQEFYESIGIPLKETLDHDNSKVNPPASGFPQSDGNSLLGHTQRNEQSMGELSCLLIPDKGDDVPVAEQLPPLDRQFLRVPGTFKISHVKKYIAKKLQLKSNVDSIELRCNGALLGSELSLHFVYRTRWFDNTRDLVLQYRKHEED